MRLTKNQNIILTGSTGMIGYHLRCHLHAKGFENVALTSRTDLETKQNFRTFLDQKNFDTIHTVIHCAGINRPEQEADFEKNTDMADIITSGLSDQKTKLIYLNTIQSEQPNPYGHSKKKAAEIFSSWANKNNSPFLNLILPNIFGEFTKPFYNSVVATFSHQLFNDQLPKIIDDREIPLLHVSHVCDYILNFLETGETSEQATIHNHIKKMNVSALLELLSTYKHTYVENNIFPEMGNTLERQMFNTFRSFAPENFLSRKLNKYTDDRGYLFETVKADCGGQGFTSLTYPGITRGNHFHLHKIERFLVISGEAEICLQRLFTDDINRINVTGEEPHIVDIPTLHTHNITNIGNDNVITQFWTDEIFNPEQPDTYTSIIESEYQEYTEVKHAS